MVNIQFEVREMTRVSWCYRHFVVAISERECHVVDNDAADDDADADNHAAIQQRVS